MLHAEVYTQSMNSKSLPGFHFAAIALDYIHFNRMTEWLRHVDCAQPPLLQSICL